MNRQEYRRKQREEEKLNIKVNYNVNGKNMQVQKDYIAKVIDEKVNANLQRVQQTFLSDMFAVLSIVLHDEYGFGHQRLTKILEKCNSQYACLKGGYITREQLFELCQKTVGINFKVES